MRIPLCRVNTRVFSLQREAQVCPVMLAPLGENGNPRGFFVCFRFFKESRNLHQGLSGNTVCELSGGCTKGQIRLWE